MDIVIRSAAPDDAEALLAIYAPYVKHTAVTFEYEVPAVDEFRRRIVRTLERFPYLVATDGDGRILGYAYAGIFQERAAYSHCAETSVYVAQDRRGQGIGTRLYAALEERLRAQGILNMNACITWLDTPDEYVTHDSPAFHERLGFTRCALFHKCGWKFGRWYDMIWMEKMLGEHKPSEKSIVF